MVGETDATAERHAAGRLCCWGLCCVAAHLMLLLWGERLYVALPYSNNTQHRGFTSSRAQGWQEGLQGLKTRDEASVLLACVQPVVADCRGLCRQQLRWTSCALRQTSADGPPTAAEAHLAQAGSQTALAAHPAGCRLLHQPADSNTGSRTVMGRAAQRSWVS